MSETPLNDIKIDQLSHASGVGMTTEEEITTNNPSPGQKKSKIPSWLSQILQYVKEPKITKSNPEPKIPMVSSDADQVHGGRACYVPSAVSIGPYHYSDRTDKLREVEKLKAPMTCQFLEGCGEKLEDLCTKVQQVVQQTRKFYNERIIRDFDDEEFFKMMFIDGCFILQFILCNVYRFEKLEMTAQQVASVKLDLLLLENQLPFPVLESLMKASWMQPFMIRRFLRIQIFGPGPGGEESIWLLILIWIIDTVEVFVSMIERLHLSDKICSCCHGLRICPPDSDQKPEPQKVVEEAPRSRGDNEPAHLVEFLYSKYVKSKNEKGIYPELSHRNTRRQPLYYSAKNLKRVGIHFQPSSSDALTDLEFKSSIFFGTLKIPPIAVNESTKLLLLSLAAYEKSTSPDQSWVASYICFMDSLINDAEDVEELRSNGILLNYLGDDQQVADLFNEMGKYLKPDSTYNDIIKKINNQCESRTSKWIAEWQQKYFKSPWTIIAVLAAASGLALTAVQTYYAKYPSCK